MTDKHRPSVAPELVIQGKWDAPIPINLEHCKQFTSLRNLRFSQRWCRWFMLCHWLKSYWCFERPWCLNLQCQVVQQEWTVPSHCWTAWHWRWRQHGPWKRRKLEIQRRSVTPKKTWIFSWH